MMKMTCNAADLANALKNSAAQTRPMTIPVLACVHLSAEGDRLDITTNDLAVSITKTIECSTDKDGFAICIPVQRLQACLTGVAGDVHVEVNKDETVTVTDDGRLKYVIEAVSADDFPMIELSDKAHDPGLTGESLLHVISTIGYAVAKGDVREWCNCLILDRDAAVATNGHRISRVDLPVNIECMALIPRETIAKVTSFLTDDSTIRFYGGVHDEPVGFVTIANTEGQMRVVCSQSKPADWRQFIPKPDKADGTYFIDQRDLLQAATRLAAFEHEWPATACAILTLAEGGEQCRLLTRDQQHHGNIVETLECTSEGEPGEVAINLRYMREAVTKLSGVASVRWEIHGGSKHLLYADDVDHVHLVMGVQI